MKTLYIFVLLGALCLSAFAQTTVTVPRQSKHFLWDEGNWEYASDQFYTYTSRAQVQESIMKVGTINQSRTVNTYENNRLKETTAQSWSILNNAWEDVTKLMYEYDARGRTMTITIQTKFGLDPLKNSIRSVYTYNGNDANPTTVLHQSWDEAGNAWENSSRDTNLMWSTDGANPYGLITAETQDYNSSTNTWVSTERVNTSYNTTTRKLTITTEVHTGTNWENDTREILTYDAKRNIVSMLDQEWQNNAWAFDGETQIDYIYNANDVLTERITKTKDEETGPFENAFRDVYSDFQIFNIMKSPEQLPQSSLAVFPNPTAQDLNITLKSVEFREAQVELVNAQGTKVYEAAISHRSLAAGAHVIPTEHLAAGMYILHIRTDNNKEIARRVVKH
ncbi:T9SS type A sorting domain-containing protein [Rufibacter psychrotolerans]|uniref:T9SS type A sorting domain-containing protein n=1 Tax=Rufibacter psychrotolerans TaxID=2812556 RepID=UPI001966E1B4|nr:T9SS type A sorting domain-containing protein [Rufibacter sp. SYSU D00308]